MLHGSLGSANSYIRRKDDVAAGRDISSFGPKSRMIADRCGLGPSPTVLLGTWSLEAEQWDPLPSEILRRTITLAIIKAHFIDRATGLTVAFWPR